VDGAGEHIPPGTSTGGAKRVVIFAARNIQKFYDLCRGNDGHGWTNHVHRIMHILDVISSVSKSTKCIRPHWGRLQRSQDLRAEFERPTSKAATSKGRGGRGRQWRRCVEMSHIEQQMLICAFYSLI